MFRFLLPFACLLVGLGTLPAQDTRLIDSLRQELADHPQPDSLHFQNLGLIWNAYLYNRTDSSLHYARRVLRDAEQTADPQYRALGHRLLGVSYQHLSRADSALYHYREAGERYRQLGNAAQEGVAVFNTAILYQEFGYPDTARLYLARADSLYSDLDIPTARAAIYELMARIERNAGKARKAVEYSIRSYEFAVEAGDSSRMADAEMAIGRSHYDLRQPAAALPYFESALQTYRRAHDDYFAASALLEIIGAYREMDQFQQALSFTEEVENIVNGQEYLDLRGNLQLEKGYLFNELREYARAEAALLEATSLSREASNSEQYAIALGALAEAQIHQPGKLQAAYDTGLEALRMAERQHRYNLVQEVSGVLATAAEGLGRPGAAVTHVRRQLAMQDSLYQDELARTVADLTLSFEKEQQDLVISEQQSRLARLNGEARITRLENRLLWVGILLTLTVAGIIGYVAYRRYRRQQQQRETLRETIKEQRRKLSAHAVQMARKGELLQSITEELATIRGERPADRKRLHSLTHELGEEDRSDQDWDNFREYFQGVHRDFEDRLRASADGNLSLREIRLASLIRMQLSNQEIGNILNTSQQSLYKAKYRLRKKLPDAGEGELDGYLQAL